MVVQGSRRLALEVIEAARLLVEKELNTLSSGNVSAICRREGFIVMTPSGLGKHDLSLRDLVYYDARRKVFLGSRKPTREYRLHTLVYEINEKAGSVVHAHSPATIVVHAARGIEALREAQLVENEYVVGRISEIEPAPPGSVELAERVARATLYSDVVIIPNHGVVAVASTPLEGVERILALETVAMHIVCETCVKTLVARIFE